MDRRKQRDRDFHERTAHLYHSTVVDPRAAGNDALFAPIVKQLKAAGRGRLRMLDLGAGTGHMTLRLIDLCDEITLVDHSSAMLSEARRRLSTFAPSKAITFAEGDLIDWASKAIEAGRTFDVVVTVGVLHHLASAELEQLAGHVRRLIASHGHWLLAEPVRTNAQEPALLARWNARYRRSFVLPWAGVEEPDEGPIDPEVLRGALRSAGFAPVFERRGWEVFPRWGVIHRLAAPFLSCLDQTSGPVHCGLYR